MVGGREAGSQAVHFQLLAVAGKAAAQDCRHQCSWSPRGEKRQQTGI